MHHHQLPKALPIIFKCKLNVSLRFDHFFLHVSVKKNGNTKTVTDPSKRVVCSLVFTSGSALVAWWTNIAIFNSAIFCHIQKTSFRKLKC